MARWNFVVWGAVISMMSGSLARPDPKGLPPEMVALMLRMTLPVTPRLADLIVAMQAESWLHLVATATA